MITESRFNINTLESGVWYRLIYKRKANASVTWGSGYTIDDVALFGIRFTLFRNGSIHFRKPKIELGNIETDWSPAPEDVETEMEDLVILTETQYCLGSSIETPPAESDAG